jgi:tetratricopeptide (TPR) repeat protein
MMNMESLGEWTVWVRRGLLMGVGCLCLSGCSPITDEPPLVSQGELASPELGERRSVSLFNPVLSEADIQEARALVEEAHGAYGEGDYAGAEKFLRQAIAIYPFLMEANLLLGKIFLIRGSANRDYELINNARLMFEMARALEPNLAESSALLDLFGARSVD